MLENPIDEHICRFKAQNLGVLRTPKFFESRLTSAEANKAGWEGFKQGVNPFLTIQNDGRVEFALAAKNAAWGSKDLCIYAGGPNAEIEEIKDFTLAEGISFFELNFHLAQEVLKHGNQEVHVSIGFNPDDLGLVGNHSIRRLHSHLYVVSGEDLVNTRTRVNWKDMDWYDRLSFVEPFYCLHHDMLKHLVENRHLLGQFLSRDGVEDNNGYSSVYLKKSDSLSGFFGDLDQVYKTMKKEYAVVEKLFTDKALDEETGRYRPLPEEVRVENVEKYLETADYLSEQSKKLLRYLAHNLKQATPGREKRVIDSSGNAWLAKGFAGAMTFTFLAESDEVRMDFIPRVMTTTGVTKTVTGKGNPSIIERVKRPATSEERVVMDDYHELITRIALRDYDTVVSGHSLIIK
jgi:hypothetical protein